MGMFFRLFLYVAYCCLWNILSLIDKLLFRVQLQKKNTAFRRNILLRMKPRPTDLVDLSNPLDFLGLGGTSVDCNYVLSDHVTLYCVYGNMVVFVETPKDMNIYNTEQYPFFLETQFYEATHIVMMSLENAYSVANQIKDPQTPCVCLFHTGRAGSTLMAQIFNKTRKARVLSMPDCYHSLLTIHSGFPMEVKGKLTLMITRLLCKPLRKDEDIQVILLKLQSKEKFMMPLFDKYVPWMKKLFMYRNGLSSVLSIERKWCIANSELVFKWNWLKHVYFTLIMYPYHGRYNTDHVDSHFLLLAWRYMRIMAYMIECRKKYNFYTIKFEDLIASPDDTIRDIFATCGMTTAVVKMAKTALDRHSQENSKFYKNTNIYKPTPFAGETQRKTEKISRNFNLTPLDADFRL